VGPEAIDEMERELRQALERRPAPPSLKLRLMERRRREQAQRQHSRMVLWQRLAASLTLAAALGGVLAWRSARERRRGEEARQQVLTALRITTRALNEMESQLAARNRDAQE